MKYLITLFILSAFSYAGGPIEDAFEGKYKAYHKHKAMAIAVDPNTGAWAYAMSMNDGSTIGAKRRAMRGCRARVKAKKINGQCVLYAVNDKVLITLD